MKKGILKIIRLTGTVYILEYLHTHTKGQYTDLISNISIPTINARLNTLRKLKLIEHHFVREDTRKEWYELTEKGEKVIQLIKKLQNYDKVKKDKKKGILNIISRKKTAFILEYINTHTEAHYKDLLKTVGTHTLNARLRAFLDYNFIEHHFVREETRKEWYTITEKGKEILEHIKKLQELLTYEDG
ncbi:MAG: winged helix-turn-helix transcriptional regulator [Candidatus Methanofastidiosia archaeon]